MPTAVSHSLRPDEPDAHRPRLRAARRDRLSEFALFEGLDPRAIEELASASPRLSVARGRVVFLPGEPAETLYFVVSGRVKVSRLSGAGKELTLDIHEPGDFFGEVEALDASPRETLAEVLEPATLIAVPAAAFRRLSSSLPRLSSRLVVLLGRRRRALEKRLLGIVTKSAAERLAELLLQLGKVYGVRDARGTLLRIKLSQSAIGNLLGVSREMVNHTFADLKRRGVVEIANGRIVLRDPVALTKLAS